MEGTRDMSRRGFLVAAGLGGAAVAMGISGCGSQASAGATAAEATEADSAEVAADNTYEGDIVIVGSGTSGLAAAVQAGYEGAKALVVEQLQTYGGNASAVEALFAVGDRLAAEQGVEYTVADVVHTELEYSNYRTNGNLWTDLVKASEENYYWLIDQGVHFSGVVAKGSGLIPVAHVFETKEDDGLYPYATPMFEKATELGAEFYYSEQAFKLAVDDSGAVCGVYATNSQGGTDLFIGKAVILASGGFACNKELFARTGWFGLADEFLTFVVAQNAGKGYEMASELGAGDTVPWAAGINTSYVYSLGDKNAPGRTISTSPFVVWLNENGERFVNEDFATTTNRQAIANPLRNQRERYVVVDRGVVELVLSEKEGMLEKFDEVAEGSPDDLFVGDTIDEAAEAAGLDPQTVAEALAAYNGYCEAGKDAEFLKDAKYLKAMAQAPFYVGKMTLGTCATFGGIMTDRDFQVVKPDQTPIAGLYAIGTDGCMLYRDTYTICVPTSAAAHHVNSGRHAAMNAAAYSKAL